MPSSLQRDNDGNLAIEAQCKSHYKEPAEFADRAAEDRFAEVVLGVLCDVHPELFNGGAA